MYTWIRRHLPGGHRRRAAVSPVLVPVVALLLFAVSPWIEPALPLADVPLADVLPADVTVEL
ncbi:hypothetical protein [Modestobacter sp. SYSU DS0657]